MTTGDHQSGEAVVFAIIQRVLGFDQLPNNLLVFAFSGDVESITFGLRVSVEDVYTGLCKDLHDVTLSEKGRKPEAVDPGNGINHIDVHRGIQNDALNYF